MTLRIFTEPQQGASYDQLLTVALAAEECGFGAFFRSDHVLKMGSATGLPAATDAWITLAGLARDTHSIRLGTLVTPVTFRQLGMFAVAAAQVDQMSDGRVEVGLGAGWYDAEHTAFGIAFPPVSERYDLLEDQLAILHGVWTAPPGATFEHVGPTGSVEINADTIRPKQEPHPPIVLGGRAGTRGARLAVTYADEYNVAFVAADAMRDTHNRVRVACESSGRDPGSVIYSTAQVVCCGSDEAEIARRAAAIGREVSELRSNGLAGTPAEILEKLGQFVEAGAERFYLQVLDLTDLDHLQLLAQEVLPHAPGR
jgi:alkanesulfonate monooxygenase SsuD/methylene tetrahydromethanopterin reductase-like flavin-dependent oxidoreductase (luciferase family)